MLANLLPWHTKESELLLPILLFKTKAPEQTEGNINEMTKSVCAALSYKDKCLLVGTYPKN